MATKTRYYRHIGKDWISYEYGNIYSEHEAGSSLTLFPEDWELAHSRKGTKEENTKIVKAYFKKYFASDYIEEDSLEFKSLLRILNKKDKHLKTNK